MLVEAARLLVCRAAAAVDPDEDAGLLGSVVEGTSEVQRHIIAGYLRG